MDTKGARECSYLEHCVINVTIVKKHFLLEQHTKEIKEEVSMVKLNISYYHKVIIQLTNLLLPRNTKKEHSLITT